MYSNMDTYDDLSMDNMYPTNFPAMMPQHRLKRERSYCAICGAKATGINFDVLTVRRSLSKMIFIKTHRFSVHHAKRFFDEMESNHW